MGSEPVQPLQYAPTRPTRRPPAWVWVFALVIALQLVIWPLYFRHHERQRLRRERDAAVRQVQQLERAVQRLEKQGSPKAPGASPSAQQAWDDIEAQYGGLRAEIEAMTRRSNDGPGSPATRRSNPRPAPSDPE